MATDLGELAAKIKLDTSGLAPAATEAKAHVKAVGDEAGETVKKVAKLSESLGSLVSAANKIAENTHSTAVQMANLNATMSQMDERVKAVAESSAATAAAVKNLGEHIGGAGGAAGDAEKPTRDWLAALAGLALFKEAVGWLREFSAETVDAARSMNGLQSRMAATFGREGAEQVERWAATVSRSLGQGQHAMEKMVLGAGQILAPNVGAERANEMARGLAETAANAAARFGLPTEEAMQAMTEAMSGEVEGLKRLGIAKAEAQVKEFLHANGIHRTLEEMSVAQRQIVVYEMLQQKLAGTTGEAAKKAEGLSAAERMLSDDSERLAASIGQSLIPATTAWVKFKDDTVQMLLGMSDGTKMAIVGVGSFAAVLGTATIAVAAFTKFKGELVEMLSLMKTGFIAVAEPIITVTAALLAGVAAIAAVRNMMANKPGMEGEDPRNLSNRMAARDWANQKFGDRGQYGRGLTPEERVTYQANYGGWTDEQIKASMSAGKATGETFMQSFTGTLKDAASGVSSALHELMVGSAASAAAPTEAASVASGDGGKSLRAKLGKFQDESAEEKAAREAEAKAYQAYYAVLNKRAEHNAQLAKDEEAKAKQIAAQQQAALDLKASIIEHEKQMLEAQIADVQDAAGLGRRWVQSIKDLFTGGTVDVEGLVGDSVTKGLTGLSDFGKGKFDGAIVAVTDQMEQLSSGLVEAATPMVSAIADIATAAASLPAGIVSMVGSAAGVLAGVLSSIIDVVKQQAESVQRGVGDVFKGTVGLAATKALGDGGMVSAAQNSMSVAGGFAGTGVGMAGLFVMANPVIAGALAVFGALVVMLNPVLVLGTGFALMVPAVVALGAGLLQLSTQSKQYAEFQRAVAAVTQKVADAMGPMWRNLLPLVAVASHLVDGLSGMFRAFQPGTVVVHGLFEAAKLAGLGLLNFQIAILNVEYGFWSFLDMLVKFSRALEDWLPGRQGTMADPGIYDEWQRVERDRAAAMNARGALEGLTWGAAMAEGALLAAADSASKAGEELTNVPSGYKVALARWREQDAKDEEQQRRMPSGGGQSNTVNINVSGGEPQRIVQALMRELERLGFERGTGATMLYAPALLNR